MYNMYKHMKRVCIHACICVCILLGELGVTAYIKVEKGNEKVAQSIAKFSILYTNM